MIFVISAALTACSGKAPGGKSPTEQPVTVITVHAAAVTLTRELPGRTVPHLVAEVRPQATGIVRARLFREGSTVRAGDALYQLDDALYRAQLQSSEAALAKADAALVVMTLAAHRAQELSKTHLISAQDLDTAVANERQAQAEVASAKAAVETSRVNLAYTRISAPITGRIGKSAVTAGALVVANQDQPLATIQQLDPIYVEVSQASRDWLQLKQEIDAGTVKPGGPGTSVAIILEDGRRYPVEGRLEFADVTVDMGTGSFAIRAIVPNPNDTLLPGMYVKAVLDEGVLPDALLVPQAAVAHDATGKASVAIVGKDGRLAIRPVVTDRAVGDSWLVASGLVDGDRVVVEGLMKAHPGDKVTPVENTPAAATAAPAGKR